MDAIGQKLADLMAFLIGLPKAAANWVWNSLVDLIIYVGNLLAARLPDTLPLTPPDLAPLKPLLAGFGMVNRFVDLASLFAVLAVILIVESALLIYTAVRAVYGVAPTAK